MERKTREIRYARRFGVDLIAVGMALADAKQSMNPAEMSTKVGKKLMQAIRDKNREGFAAVMSHRFGVEMKDGETAGQTIQRHIRTDNAEESAKDAVSVMLEMVDDDYGMEDIAASLERCLSVIQLATENKNEAKH